MKSGPGFRAAFLFDCWFANTAAATHTLLAEVALNVRDRGTDCVDSFPELFLAHIQAGRPVSEQPWFSRIYHATKIRHCNARCRPMPGDAKYPD